MYVRLFFKENTTGSVRCGRGERKDTDGIKAEGVYGNGNGNFFSIKKKKKMQCAHLEHLFLRLIGRSQIP